MAKTVNKQKGPKKLGMNKQKGTKGEGKVTKKHMPKKKKSIHSNTFEERQENIKRKDEFLRKKQQRKENKKMARDRMANLITEVSAWAKDNPIHPSTVAPPTQLGLEVKSVKNNRSFKAFLRNLPKDVKFEEIDQHFLKRGVKLDCIRLFTHRKTNVCLGFAFLEFHNRMDFEKSLTLNVSRFRNDRILVEGSLRNFRLSKKLPMKLISYNPPADRKYEESEIDMEVIEVQP